MPVLLKQALAPDRTFTVRTWGGDVVFRMAPLSYPAERALSVETRAPEGAAEASGLEAELQWAEVIAKRLDAEIQVYGEGWEGVTDEAGEPLPLTAETFRAFRNLYWEAAEDLFRQLAADRAALSAAGNPSGRSPATPTA